MELVQAADQLAATSEVLRAISSSRSDPGPVLKAVAEHAARLCDADISQIFQIDGDFLRVVASHGPIPSRLRGEALRISRGSVTGRAVIDRRTIHVDDLSAQLDKEFPDAKPHAGLWGHRTTAATPLLREQTPIGAIFIRRTEVRPFSQQQIAVLETFAAQASIAIEQVRLVRSLEARNAQLSQALDREAATGEILQVINRSPTVAEPVFEAILGNALRLCGAHLGTLFLFDGESFRLVAHRGAPAEWVERRRTPLRPGPHTGLARAVTERRPVHIIDVTADRAHAEHDQTRLETIELLGARSGIWVPMLKEERAVGVITMWRREVQAFTDSQIDLLVTFAAQAVIAMENVRLFSETKEALEQQTATSEILGVLSGSPTDLAPVFDAILKSSMQLCDAHFGLLNMREGDKLRTVAQRGGSAEFAKWVYERGAFTPDGTAAEVLAQGRAFNIADARDGAGNRAGEPNTMKFVNLGGVRSVLAVPLMKDGRAIGNIGIYRPEVRPFTDKQVALVTMFANQAVIAIENVRLFKELEARNKDLGDSLEQQTATADILRVISGTPTDVQPVFEAIVRSGLKVFAGAGVGIAIADDERVRIVAAGGILGPMAAKVDMPRTRESATGAAIVDRTVVNIIDTEAPDAPPYARDNGRALGFRAIAAAPMLREGQAIGAIGVTLRDPGGLSDKQLELLKTFADQAVIAIENVRLFNETKEALEQQTGTTEILKVISQSPTDTKPVFEIIAERAVKLCDAGISVVARFDGKSIHLVASHGVNPKATELMGSIFPMRPEDETVMARTVRNRAIVHVADVLADATYSAKDVAAAAEYRSSLGVPMMRAGEVIGGIFVARAKPGLFSDKQVVLLQTFADQAVIAIENVRLFKELQERTEALTKSVSQLTALGEVGQAISSTLELETVLKTIVSRAVQLTGLDAGAIYEYDERAEEFHLRAAENLSEDILEILRSRPIKKGDGAVGSTAVVREPIQIPETQDESYKSGLRDLVIRAGRRALLAVPLMREDHIIGALAVQRNAPGPFAPEVVELLKTFATQSAMAIQNARLFREIAEKSRQLEVASRHKSQFLASMSHELRTPLNAILGFNEMVIDEIYGPVPEGMKSPLENIQSSGKHLLRLINNVLDLAKIEAGRMELALSDYSVQDTVSSVHSTLRPLAAEKGLEFVAEVSPDIPPAHGDAGRLAQCLMNLAGNSLKFTRQGRVAIAVAQRDGLLRFSVADTGIGIPPEKIASLFTEFKQTDATIASEYGGTGLGLSITKKFIEMHGGRIWVESEPGKGSNFLFEIPLKVGR